MHMCVTTILYTAIMVFAITGIGYAIGKLNKFGDSDELVNLDDKQGEDKMTTTQIWMLCFVGVMVLLMILSAVWNQMGKKNREEQ